MALFATISLLAAACALWLIRVKRSKNYWLPILAVISQPRRKLSPLEIRLPVLLPFLCFLICAGILLYFSTKPYDEKLEAKVHKSQLALLFVDLSPSVSASIRIQDYRVKIADYISEQSKGMELILYTSYSNTPLPIRDRNDLERALEWVNSLDFHRAGLDLAHALSLVASNAGAADTLIVFSDLAKANIQLNWPIIEEKMAVSFETIRKPEIRNLFIKDAEFLADPSSPLMEWEITIARNFKEKASSGRIGAYEGSTLLQEIDYKIEEGRSESKVKINWGADKIRADESAVSFLRWKIKSTDTNDLALDDEFRTPVYGNKHEVVIVADPQGEVPFGDPAHFLKIALEVRGIDVKRYDNLDYLQKSVPRQEQMQIAFIGKYKELSHYCPAPDKVFSGKNPAILWLTPYELKGNYEAVCDCFAALTLDTNEKQSYCKEGLSREALSQVFFSVGAKKIGGTIGATDAFAWMKEKAGVRIYAGLLPLVPSITGPIPHAMMATLVRDILVAVGVGGLSKDTPVPFERIEDISRTRAWSEEGEKIDPGKLVLSNIPVFESLFADNDFAMGAESKNDLKANISTISEKDRAFPFERATYLLALISFLLTLEAIFHFRKRKRLISTLLFLLCLHPKIRSEELQILGSSAKKPELSELLKEVEARTSLRFASEPNILQSAEKASAHGLVWALGTEALVGKDIRLHENLRRWLIRGGFLVIEGFSSKEKLDSMLAGFNEQDDKQPQWLSIGINHELLRSFYILKPLPVCKDQGWYGLFYDGRTAAIAMPQHFAGSGEGCSLALEDEQNRRIFINILMVAMTMDYKNSQVHINATLDRLRY